MNKESKKKDTPPNAKAAAVFILFIIIAAAIMTAMTPNLMTPNSECVDTSALKEIHRAILEAETMDDDKQVTETSTHIICLDEGDEIKKGLILRLKGVSGIGINCPPNSDFCGSDNTYKLKYEGERTGITNIIATEFVKIKVEVECSKEMLFAEGWTYSCTLTVIPA